MFIAGVALVVPNFGYADDFKCGTNLVSDDMIRSSDNLGEKFLVQTPDANFYGNLKQLNHVEIMKLVYKFFMKQEMSPKEYLFVLVTLSSFYPKEEVFQKVGELAEYIPLGVCWLDTNNVVMGINKPALSDIGGKRIEDFVGKSMYDLYSKEIADSWVDHNIYLMNAGKEEVQRGSIKEFESGKIVYFDTYKVPLFNNEKNVIGIVSVSTIVDPESKDQTN